MKLLINLQEPRKKTLLFLRRRGREFAPKRRYGITILRCVKPHKSAEFYCSLVRVGHIAWIGSIAFLLRVKNRDGICLDPIRLTRSSYGAYIKTD